MTQDELTWKAAQTAYEAYCSHTGWKSLATGCDLPTWDNLTDNIKYAWQATAHALGVLFTHAQYDELACTWSIGDKRNTGKTKAISYVSVGA